MHIDLNTVLTYLAFLNVGVLLVYALPVFLRAKREKLELESVLVHNQHPDPRK